MDLHPEVKEEVLTSLTKACVEVLKRLGKEACVVMAFRIKFFYFGRDFVGPVITVHIKDPLGRKTSYGTDYRFIGRKKIDPTADEIVEFLYPELSTTIKKFLKKARKNFSDIKEELDGMKV